MKGQFFIIASVIMVSATMLLVQYLFDFAKTDLTKLEERRELDYIQPIKDVLIQTAKESDCSVWEKELAYTESFVKSQMIKKGIVFDSSHRITDCTVYFDFTLKTTNSLTKTEFTYPS